MIRITDVRRKGRTDFEVCSETATEFIAGQKFLDQNGIVPGAEFEEEDFEQIKAKAQLIFGIRTALSILERKDRSRKELYRKLREKGIEDDVAQMTVEYMANKGYQDDLRYAVRLAELNAGLYGKRRVEELLYHHGIDRETIRTVIDEVFRDEAAEEEKIDAILSKAAAGKDISDPAVRNKLYAKLARLGFEPARISAALRRAEERRKDEIG